MWKPTTCQPSTVPSKQRRAAQKTRLSWAARSPSLPMVMLRLNSRPGNISHDCAWWYLYTGIKLFTHPIHKASPVKKRRDSTVNSQHLPRTVHSLFLHHHPKELSIFTMCQCSHVKGRQYVSVSICEDRLDSLADRNHNKLSPHTC